MFPNVRRTVALYLSVELGVTQFWRGWDDDVDSGSDADVTSVDAEDPPANGASSGYKARE